VKNCAAALRFGSAKVTVYVGARGVNGTLNILGRGEQDYDGHHKGVFITPGKVENAVFKAAKQAGEFSRTEIDKIFVGVPADFCAFAVRDVSMSYERPRKIRIEDLEELYKLGDIYGGRDDYKVISRSPVFFTTDDNRKVVDMLGQKTTKLGAKISYALAGAGFVSFVETIMREMNVTAVFVPEALAQFQYLFDAERRAAGAVFADVGGIVTSVILAKGDGLLAGRSFAMGGSYISRDLMDVLGTDYHSAEALKNKVMLTLDVGESDTYDVAAPNGRSTQYFNARSVNEIVNDRLEMLAKKISDAIRNCGVELPEYLPLSLTGCGVTQIRGAKEQIARTLKRETVIVAPPQPLYEKPALSGIMSLLNMAVAQTESEKRGIFG